MEISDCEKSGAVILCYQNLEALFSVHRFGCALFVFTKTRWGIMMKEGEEGMKQVLAIILALSLVLALGACGNGKTQITPTPEPTEEPVEETRKEIKIGETIKTTSYELTIEEVVVGYSIEAAVEIQNRVNVGVAVRNNPDGLAYLVVTVKNLQRESMKIGNSKRSYIRVQVDYNNGYRYDPDDVRLDQGGSFYAPPGAVDIAPLDTMRSLWQIPIVEDVFMNRDNPLYILITMGDGEEYWYIVEDSDFLVG